MSEEKNTFEPIMDQETFDKRVGKRLAAEREKVLKEESLVPTERFRQVNDARAALEAQLEQRDAELSELRRSHYLEGVEQEIRGQLASHGVTEEDRVQRLLRFVDMKAIEENPGREDMAVQAELNKIANDFPGVLSVEEAPPLGGGLPRGRSDKPVLNKGAHVTREELEQMGPEEIVRRGLLDTARDVLKGEF
jgi:hypothetical protein